MKKLLLLFILGTLFYAQSAKADIRSALLIAAGSIGTAYVINVSYDAWKKAKEVYKYCLERHKYCLERPWMPLGIIIIPVLCGCHIASKLYKNNNLSINLK